MVVQSQCCLDSTAAHAWEDRRENELATTFCCHSASRHCFRGCSGSASGPDAYACNSAFLIGANRRVVGIAVRDPFSMGRHMKLRNVLIACAAVGVITLAPADAAAGNATYRYDNLGRLTEVNYGTGVVVKYAYDAAGNRSTELVTGTGVLSPEATAALMAILTRLLLDDD